MNKEEAKKIFGENFKRLRLKCGMSQEELAKALGYTNRSSVNKIELGKNDLPRDKVARAAQVLGCSPLDFFQEEPADIQVETKGAKFVIEFQHLTESNQALVLAYMKALSDSQEKKDGNT